MKAALTTIEKNKKLNKVFKIEPSPKYIRDIIIARRLRYLKAHPKKKRKLEARLHIEEFNKQIQKYEEESKLKNYMDIDFPADIEEEIDSDITKDEKYKEHVQHLEKLSEEERQLQQTIEENNKKVEELEKTIETGKSKEQEYQKKQQDIVQKIEELKSRKRKMFEMMKK